MKKVFFLLIAVLILSVSVFADASPVYFSSTLNSVSSTTELHYTTSSNAYIFMVDGVVNFISLEAGEFGYIERTVNGETSNYTRDIDSLYTSGNNSYYRKGAGFSPASDATITPSLTSFSNSATSDDIYNAFVDFLSNPPVDAISTSLNVPAGNVLYFKVATEQDINLVANMPVLSNLIGSPWSSGVQYGAAAALPTSSTVFPIASQDPVNFTKSNTETNILGQTKIGLATKHCVVGQYYALYCPFHYGDFIAYGTGSSNYDSANAGIVGANVTVSGDLIDIKVYPLSQRISQNVLGSVDLVSGSDDGYSSYYDGTVNADGSVTWTDQDGDIAAPTVGGQNYVPEEVSTQSIVGQIKDVLNNIVSEIKNLFSFGYEAIQSLVGLFSDFVSVLQQFYTWLPSPVYSALVSAIVISITIGVFKVFL